MRTWVSCLAWELREDVFPHFWLLCWWSKGKEPAIYMHMCACVFLTMSLIKNILKIRDISVNFSCFCDKTPRGRNSVSEGLILTLSSRSRCIMGMVLEALLTFHPQLMSRVMDVYCCSVWQPSVPGGTGATRREQLFTPPLKRTRSSSTGMPRSLALSGESGFCQVVNWCYLS